MIKIFQHKGLKRLFEKGDQRGVPAHLAGKITRRLDAIDAAVQVTDLNLPGFNLHGLKGGRKGTWSITVSGNWRITFEFRDGDAYIVDFEDYH
jgi:toxin HigB-1